MEADVSEIKQCCGTLESYDEIEVISENKDIPREVDVVDSVSGSEVSVKCGSSTDSLSASDSAPPISPLFRLFEHDLGGVPTKGPRYKLLLDGDLQVCYLNHTRTVISKILSSKFLRRWESHRVYLNPNCISSKTVSSPHNHTHPLKIQILHLL